MGQAYSNPKRESDPHALPDLEVWEDAVRECPVCLGEQIAPSEGVDFCTTDGCPGKIDATNNPKKARLAWWWWSCSPGCLPDGEPAGPFETEAEALVDARDGVEDDEDEEGA